MKIKNTLAVFIIVGDISYALYCSLITDFLLKYGETIHTKAVVEEKLTDNSSYPVLRYRFYGSSVKCVDAYHAVHIVLI